MVINYILKHQQIILPIENNLHLKILFATNNLVMEKLSTGNQSSIVNKRRSVDENKIQTLQIKYHRALFDETEYGLHGTIEARPIIVEYVGNQMAGGVEWQQPTG